MAAATPTSTPKRKRDQMSMDGIPNINTALQFTFDSKLVDCDDGPRSSVTSRFRGLALESGVVGRSPDMDVDMNDGIRKRVKIPSVTMTDFSRPSADLAEQTTLNSNSAAKSRFSPKPKSARFALDEKVTEQAETVANTHLSHTHARHGSNTGVALSAAGVILQPFPNPIISNKNKPRSRPVQRAGTPPPPPADTSFSPEGVAAAAPVITDPLRASLTWHDDEISMYDPDDSDDDGEGINGIGFKPTPAIAHERKAKRSRQLAEYRKREEREARDKRSQRRGGRVNSPAPTERDQRVKKAKNRRVRFLDSVSVGETVSIEG